MRIVMMAFRLFLKTPYYFLRIWYCSVNPKVSYEEGFRIAKKATTKANRAGKVTIDARGMENLPKENGFVLFPNHQGLFDVLAFLESCPVPFAFVIKKEASNVILLKQIIGSLGSKVIDREDIKQSLTIINEVAKEVKEGRNFLIFAEGTRSKNGNALIDFKGGSFKSAIKAKCPIVPCALIDAYKPFDEKSLKPLTVTVLYLDPIYYEEYKQMKSVEIAALVKQRIEKAIEKAIDKQNRL